MPSGLSMSKEKRPERAHIPEIGFCEEKNRLRHQFLKAIQEMTVLHDRQMHAVIEGDSEFSRFDVLLHIAQQIKEMTKFAWINHVESHGCGEA